MEIRNNILYLGGVKAGELVEQFGSPLYVYEEDTLRERARELVKCINYKNKEIKYACKANTNIALMRIFLEYDMGIDAVSPGEIFAALKAGYRPEKILFTANNPSWNEIEYAVSKKVMVNVDSLFLLKLFGQNYPGKEVCVRINPNVGAGHHNHVITGGPESKFGISYTQVDEIKRIAREYPLKITGLHQHIGSGILNPEMFAKAMDVLLEVSVLFKDLKFIDFGGGIGVPYQEEEKRIDVTLLGKRITEDFNNFCTRYGTSLKLVIEPGRYLVAEAGFLLARVTSGIFVNRVILSPGMKMALWIETSPGLRKGILSVSAMQGLTAIPCHPVIIPAPGQQRFWLKMGRHILSEKGRVWKKYFQVVQIIIINKTDRELKCLIN